MFGIRKGGTQDLGFHLYVPGHDHPEQSEVRYEIPLNDLQHDVEDAVACVILPV